MSFLKMDRRFSVSSKAGKQFITLISRCLMGGLHLIVSYYGFVFLFCLFFFYIFFVFFVFRFLPVRQ